MVENTQATGSDPMDDGIDTNALKIMTEHLLEGETLAKLAIQYDVSRSTLHRRIVQWRGDRRFRLEDMQADRDSARVVTVDEGLSVEFADKTGHLREVHVVSTRGTDAAASEEFRGDPSKAATQAAYLASDELHRLLGHEGGECLYRGLSRNSSIGVGPGRAASSTVDAFCKLAQERPTHFRGFTSCTIYSLCGGAREEPWFRTSSRRWLDADENAAQLGHALRSDDVNFRIHWTSSENQEWMNGLKRPINLARVLVGLGVLNTQHHFRRYEHTVQLSAIADPLRVIREWQEDAPNLTEKGIREDSIADIGHRVFATRRLLDDEIKEAIDEINERVVAMPLEYMREAEEVILVAAGAQKLRALYQLVTGRCSNPPVDPANITLVTDEWTAVRIIEMVEEAKSKGDRKRKKPRTESEA